MYYNFTRKLRKPGSMWSQNVVPGHHDFVYFASTQFVDLETGTARATFIQPYWMPRKVRTLAASRDRFSIRSGDGAGKQSSI
jgi:hypothetical protein